MPHFIVTHTHCLFTPAIRSGPHGVRLDRVGLRPAAAGAVSPRVAEGVCRAEGLRGEKGLGWEGGGPEIIHRGVLQNAC